jgi:hypothetical protein
LPRDTPDGGRLPEVRRATDSLVRAKLVSVSQADDARDRAPHDDRLGQSSLDNQAFALGIPETIGCREAMLVNFPEAKTEWQGPGDHAAKYETSIALALNPDWVRLDRLTAGRDPAQVALPDTPQKNAPTHDPTHPLYAIHGQDPRSTASKDLGEKLVDEIVSRLTAKVEQAQAGRPDAAAIDGGRQP